MRQELKDYLRRIDIEISEFEKHENGNFRAYQFYQDKFVDCYNKIAEVINYMEDKQ